MDNLPYHGLLVSKKKKKNNLLFLRTFYLNFKEELYASSNK